MVFGGGPRSAEVLNLKLLYWKLLPGRIPNYHYPGRFSCGLAEASGKWMVVLVGGTYGYT